MSKSENIGRVLPPKHPPTSASRSDLRAAVRSVLIERDSRIVKTGKNLVGAKNGGKKK